MLIHETTHVAGTQNKLVSCQLTLWCPQSNPRLLHLFAISFDVGPMPTLRTFKKDPVSSLYKLFPYRMILKTYAQGLFDVAHWHTLDKLGQGPELVNAAFCDATIEWLTDLGKKYYNGPRPLRPILPFQAAAHPVDKIADGPTLVKLSYADMVAMPRINQNSETRMPPPAMQLPPPIKPKFRATVKGTRATCIYSHVPISTQTRLLSICHNNDVLYPAILMATAKVPLTASLLNSNPITWVFWSANGQFIIIQFKDDISDDMYSLFTTILSGFYNTPVNHWHYMCEDTSSYIKWTSCPMFDNLGNALSAQQYPRTILASRWLTLLVFPSSYLPSTAMVLSRFTMVAVLIAR